MICDGWLCVTNVEIPEAAPHCSNCAKKYRWALTSCCPSKAAGAWIPWRRPHSSSVFFLGNYLILSWIALVRIRCWKERNKEEHACTIVARNASSITSFTLFAPKEMKGLKTHCLFDFHEKSAILWPQVSLHLQERKPGISGSNCTRGLKHIRMKHTVIEYNR